MIPADLVIGLLLAYLFAVEAFILAELALKPQAFLAKFTGWSYALILMPSYFVYTVSLMTTVHLPEISIPTTFLLFNVGSALVFGATHLIVLKILEQSSIRLSRLVTAFNALRAAWALFEFRNSVTGDMTLPAYTEFVEKLFALPGALLICYGCLKLRDRARDARAETPGNPLFEPLHFFMLQNLTVSMPPDKKRVSILLTNTASVIVAILSISIGISLSTSFTEMRMLSSNFRIICSATLSPIFWLMRLKYSYAIDFKQMNERELYVVSGTPITKDCEDDRLFCIF